MEKLPGQSVPEMFQELNERIDAEKLRVMPVHGVKKKHPHRGQRILHSCWNKHGAHNLRRRNKPSKYQMQAVRKIYKPMKVTVEDLTKPLAPIKKAGGFLKKMLDKVLPKNQAF